MARVWTKREVEAPRVQVSRQPPFGARVAVSQQLVGHYPQTRPPHDSDNSFKVNGIIPRTDTRVSIISEDFFLR